MFCHLHVHSPYSFLDGGSSIGDLLERAGALGMPAMAVTDHDSMAGAVVFRQAAEKVGVKSIQGAEITLGEGYHLVLLARDARGYSNISKILSRAHLESERLKPRVSLEGMEVEGILCLSGCRRGEIPSLILRGRYNEALEAARRYSSIFGRDNFFLEMEASALPGSGLLNRSLKELAINLELRRVATANVHYARKEDFRLHDVLTCVRTLTRLEDVHPERRLNAENYMKNPGEVLEAVGDRVALETAEWIANECEATPNLGERHFPTYPASDARGFLERLVLEGARERYGCLSHNVMDRLRHEMGIITRLGYEDYFLVVWDIARYAREKGIRYAGRGSSADSAVSYCLRLTDVDAIKRGLLFERFLSTERAQRPDIDLDFDARYRDEVSRYVVKRYGSDRVAWVSAYSTFRARSALRDLGKAMGYPQIEIDALARRMPYVRASDIGVALERYPELHDLPGPPERYRDLLDMCTGVSSFPRHMGTHLGGIVISDYPLSGVVPLQKAAKGVVITQFDKDSLEDMGFVKIDLLSLKTLSAVDTAVSSLQSEVPSFRYEGIPLDDAATYRMLQQGETMGVFQLESPAQRSLQARLGARDMEDIVASVALIRPGPIKGNMVEPFLARRAGREEVTYLHPGLKPILEKTCGVVLFQEQVIEIATKIAGFSPGEADRLRRAMTHNRSHREMEEIGEAFVTKAVAEGVPDGTAREIFRMVKGYASYGFCEAHAAAFATTSYKTAYLIRHHPAHFFAAILSQQPMGYYSPATISVEARRRGITILPLSVNDSDRNFVVEKKGIRVSLSRVNGIREREVLSILRAREKGPFLGIGDFLERTDVRSDTAMNLILGGGFDGFGRNRRALLCDLEIRKNGSVASVNPQDFSWPERVLQEYSVLGLWVSGHYMEAFREHLSERGFLRASDLERLRDGSLVKVAGLPVRPHRPPTRSGRTVVFLSLEDETGLVDAVVFEGVYRRCGGTIFSPEPVPLELNGRLKRRGRGLSVTALSVTEMAPLPSGRAPML